MSGSSPLYAAIFLTEASREVLLSCIKPVHPVVHADHMTLVHRPTAADIVSLDLGCEVLLEVIGVVVDERTQAVAVNTPPSVPPTRNRCAHITISTAPGVPPREAGDSVADAMVGVKGKCDFLDEPLCLLGRIGVRIEGGLIEYKSEVFQCSLHNNSANLASTKRSMSQSTRASEYSSLGLSPSRSIPLLTPGALQHQCYTPQAHAGLPQSSYHLDVGSLAGKIWQGCQYDQHVACCLISGTHDVVGRASYRPVKQVQCALSASSSEGSHSISNSNTRASSGSTTPIRNRQKPPDPPQCPTPTLESDVMFRSQVRVGDLVLIRLHQTSETCRGTVVELLAEATYQRDGVLVLLETGMVGNVLQLLAGTDSPGGGNVVDLTDSPSGSQSSTSTHYGGDLSEALTCEGYKAPVGASVIDLSQDILEPLPRESQADDLASLEQLEMLFARHGEELVEVILAANDYDIRNTVAELSSQGNQEGPGGLQVNQGEEPVSYRDAPRGVNPSCLTADRQSPFAGSQSGSSLGTAGALKGEPVVDEEKMTLMQSLLPAVDRLLIGRALVRAAGDVNLAAQSLLDGKSGPTGVSKAGPPRHLVAENPQFTPLVDRLLQAIPGLDRDVALFTLKQFRGDEEKARAEIALQRRLSTEMLVGKKPSVGGTCQHSQLPQGPGRVGTPQPTLGASSLAAKSGSPPAPPPNTTAGRLPQIPPPFDSSSLTRDQKKAKADEFRARALKHRQLSGSYYQLANEARSQDPLMHRDRLVLARFHQQMAERYRADCNSLAFAAHNMNINNVHVLDLHGLAVSEAMEKLDIHVETFSQLSKRAATCSELHVITGQGKHSPNGRPAIKPCVLQYLQDSGHDHHVPPQNPGMVVILFKGQL